MTPSDATFIGVLESNADRHLTPSSLMLIRQFDSVKPLFEAAK